MSFSHNRYVLLYDHLEQKKSKVNPLKEKFPISQNEKVIIGVNSIIGAVGTTVGIIAESLWFATTSVGAGGLGLGMAGVIAACAIAGVGVVSGLIAIPVAKVFYRDLVADAENANKMLHDEYLLRIKKQKKLFFEFLRLRSLFLSEKEFARKVDSIVCEQNAEINKKLLIALTNKIYKQFEDKKFYFEPKNSITQLIRKSQNQNLISFHSLLSDFSYSTNKEIRSDVISHLSKHVGFDENISDCFKNIPNPVVKNKSKSAEYGAITGLTISGAGLGTGWAFGSLVMSAGLCAAVPVFGWALLGVGCVALGILFGIGMGLCKHKNAQRIELKNQVQKRNEILSSTNDSLKREIYQQSEKNKCLDVNICIRSQEKLKPHVINNFMFKKSKLDSINIENQNKVFLRRTKTS